MEKKIESGREDACLLELIVMCRYGELDMDIKIACRNCDSFDVNERICTIRFVVAKDKTRTPMRRRPGQSCQAFMFKIASPR